MTLPFACMLITDEGPELEARLTQALSVTTRVPLAVQLRMKNTPLAQLRAVAARVRSLTRARHVSLLINGRLDVALEVEADGVHLPSRGLSIAVARALLPDNAFIGVSCHNAEDVERAAQQGATYGLLSPIHPVEGKAPPLGVAGFAAVSGVTALPLLALGGITPDDVSALKGAGAAGIAVMRGVMQAAFPAEALRAFCDAWEAAAP